MSNTKVWTTKEGIKVHIKDMKDRHLLNTIALLERKAAELRDMALVNFPVFQGEMAQYYAERDWDRISEQSDAECAAEMFPIYEDMVEEAKRRKLWVSK